MLLLNLIDQNPIWLHIHYEDICPVDIIKKLEKQVKKRSTFYPLEYITQKASFYGEQFFIEDGVLIPRPETEILVDKAKEILENVSKPNIVEIGTGSGIISVMLAILIDNITITAVDINPQALKLAYKNAKKFGVEDKIQFIQSDLFTNIPQANYDMIVSNPPYISDNYTLPQNVKYEPCEALFSGKNGTDLLYKIIDETIQQKIPYLICEMGYDQKRLIEQYLKELNLYKLEFYKDLEGFDRGFTLSL